MTKSKANTGKTTNTSRANAGSKNVSKTHSKVSAGKSNISRAGMKQASSKSTTTQKSTTGKASTRAPAKQAGSGAGTARKAGGSSPAKSSSKQEGRQGAGPASLQTSLQPIRNRETQKQIIQRSAAEVGIDARVGDAFTRAMMTRLTRHVIRGGSGYAPFPHLGGALLRGEQAERKARTMYSPLVKRQVNVKARPAGPVPTFRPHQTLLDAVARV